MEVKEKNILTFYRGQEDIVVNEKANYMESLFKDQYTHALLQIHQLVSKQKEGVPSILAFCGDRGEGKTSCMETVKTMLASMSVSDNNETKSAVGNFMQNCVVNQAAHETLEATCKGFANTKFKVLDTIDPAFFDKDHNVIELVLGMMYREIKKQENGDDVNHEDRKELLNKFHDAKLCLTQLNKGKDLYDPIDAKGHYQNGQHSRCSSCCL